jgi:hypothetical protein
MRMLLVFTAGVALMSAPAFAQDYNSGAGQPPNAGAYPSNPNAIPGSPPADTSVQPGPAPATPPGPPPPPPPSAPPSSAAPSTEPGVTAPDTGPTQSSSRLYQSAPQQVSGQNVQIITNGPVPDNRINRARFRPLSHLGRQSRPAGN